MACSPGTDTGGLLGPKPLADRKKRPPPPKAAEGTVLKGFVGAKVACKSFLPPILYIPNTLALSTIHHRNS